MAGKKTFREKLAGEGYPKIKPIPEGLERTLGAGMLVIPAPWEVDELMRKVKRGRVTTVIELRSALSAKHGTDQACAIVTGISVAIAAGVAMEDLEQGKRRVTPYWRTLRSGGELNAKLPGGIEDQRERLESEGHVVVPRGKRLFVESFERNLVAEF